ncbi:DUF1338 family protein [bacterium]|nr:DUF1338 family protein [bacterium]
MISYFRSTMTARPGTTDDKLVDLFCGLLERYFDRVPDAARIFQLIQDRGDIISNDHVAFRSFDMRSLLKVFLPFGYEVQYQNQTEKIPFNFVQKKLTAVWLKHPNADMPRVFISQLRLDELPKVATLMQPYIDGLNDPIDTIEPMDVPRLIEYLHTGLWPTPTYKDYSEIGQHSEYLAWVLYNEYYLNHFTLTVNRLQSFDFQTQIQTVINQYSDEIRDIPEGADKMVSALCNKALQAVYLDIMDTFNTFLDVEDFVLNAPNDNALNISPDGLLLQSSTKANIVKAKFPDGTHKIPGSYVEFAYRGIKPELLSDLLRGRRDLDTIEVDDLRDGFEVGNANNIFESTYTRAAKTDVVDNITSSFETSRSKLLSFLETYPTH